MQTVKTIIADDQKIFLEGLKTVLSTYPRRSIEIVGEATNGEDLIALLKKQPAHLLIFNLNMPGKDGVEVLNTIHQLRLSPHTIALTIYDDPKIIRTAFKAGVEGYVLKDQGVEELFACINAVLQGDTFLGDGLCTNINDLTAPIALPKQQIYSYNDRFIKKHSLTKRELEILRLITQAMSNKEIAKTLYISDQTVGVHRKNIMRKLGVSNAAGLIKTAYDNSLV